MPVSENMNVSLRKFQDEAAQFCEGITDSAARLYPEQYVAALHARASNFEFKEPRNPRLFAPNRNLIRATLQACYRKHFGPPGHLRNQAVAVTNIE